MTDKMAEIFPPVIKIPEIRDAVDRNSPTLGEIMKFLGKQKFDPDQVRYEVPFSKPITAKDSESLSLWRGYEVLVMGFERDNKTVCRLMTGGRGSVSYSTIYPDINKLEVTREVFGKLARDPIFGDNGEFTGKPIVFRLHNHEHTPYPSVIDMLSSVGKKNDFLVTSDRDFVIFGKPLEYPPNPSSVGFYLHADTKSSDIFSNQGILQDLQSKIMFDVMIDLKIPHDKYGPDRDATIAVNNETLRRVSDFFGVSVIKYKFGRDNDKIQEYLNSIQTI